MDLTWHGDREVAPGMLDLAVNVRPTPEWLRAALTGLDLAAYPDPLPATAAVARRHGVTADEVLLTAGAAEAFVLLARAFRPERALCVHPSFTEPEVALRTAGHGVERLVLDPPYVLDPEQVPEVADLVVVGNPTNPTGVLHEGLERLVRDDRVLVVDEAFLEDDERSLVGHPGAVVVRSLTKAWGLAGLRVGYVVAAPEVIERLRPHQPPWSVSTPALRAAELTATPEALAESRAASAEVAEERARLQGLLTGMGVDVVPGSRAPYLLCRAPGHPEVREKLRAHGIAVRRGDTFPGLTDEHWRTAVKGRAAGDRLVQALWALLAAF